MATKQTYNACTARNKKIGTMGFYNKSYKPDLKRLFGIKSLIDERQLCDCSETEKERHLYEDAVLRLLYIEN